MGGAARIADQGMLVLVVPEIFAADRARRNESVGAGLVKLNEQTGAGDAGNAAVEGGADAVGEVMRQQPVEGLAFRLHGAPFGRRDSGRNLAQAARVFV